jgi:hypothetical protein
LVLALRFSAVSSFVTVTVAPGTAPPLASLTWPMIALVVSPWENATCGKKRTNDPAKTNIEKAFWSIAVIAVPFRLESSAS